ncbi:MAG: hypothetical protein SWK76_16975 [Actinomycetota bacterium]|nr:hypothetical protein [Actinomycetota bacterium]
MNKDNIPESKIIWLVGGILDRLKRLETLITPTEPMTGGSSGGVSPGVPAKPTNLQVASQSVVVDEAGEKLVQVRITWAGDAVAFERAIARKQG